jgi:hypothetical protein
MITRSKEVAMARNEARQVATSLRDGSLWTERFATGVDDLDFGDDRFDSAHGLASYVRATPVRRTRSDIASARIQAWHDRLRRPHPTTIVAASRRAMRAIDPHRSCSRRRWRTPGRAVTRAASRSLRRRC